MTPHDTLNNTAPHRGKRDRQAPPGSRHADNALVIVAKYPQPGKVKTRLGATIGHDRAATLYTAFLRDLSERFTAGARMGAYDLRWAAVDDTPDGADMRRLCPLLTTGGATDAHKSTTTGAVPDADRHPPCVFLQRGADLAERLYNICADMRDAGYRRLIIHGSDSPQASLAVVRNAFAALATHDAALGPATDGGYYLIGVRLDGPMGFPDLFRGVGMSEATTLRQTLARAHQLGLSVATVETTFDVDEAPDLKRLADYLRTHGAHVAPHTVAALARLTGTADGEEWGSADCPWPGVHPPVPLTNEKDDTTR